MLNPIDTSRWTRQDIIKEAKMQSDALARLGVWKRLAYSLVAVGFVLGIWGANVAATPAVVAAVICLVVGIPASAVLTVGINHGKRNVENMLTAAGVDVNELLQPRGKKGKARADRKSAEPAGKRA